MLYKYTSSSTGRTIVIQSLSGKKCLKSFLTIFFYMVVSDKPFYSSNAFSKYDLALIYSPILSSKTKLKSLSNHIKNGNSYLKSFSFGICIYNCFTNLRTLNSWFNDFSSIEPTVLKINIELKSKFKKIILLSLFSFYSKLPNPSLSIIKNFYPVSD